MNRVQRQLDDGFIETRELDEQGQPNGDYFIEKDGRCYEEGTLKNGKKDGIIEKHPNGDETKTNPEYYKDGKKQILLSALLKTLTLGQTLANKENKKAEEDIADLKLKAFIGEQLLKEFLNKVAKWSKLEQFRESFIPRKKKSNHDLLAESSQRPGIPPVIHTKATQNFAIGQMARQKYER